MMGKKLVAFLLIITTNIAGVSYEETDPLLKFTEIAESNEHTIDNWEVIIKETLTTDNPQNFVNKFRMYDLKATTEDINSINYLIEDTSNITHGITIQYNLIIPAKNTSEIELTAVIKGTKWDEKTREKYLETNKNMNKSLFSMNAKTFTCVELIEDGTIENRVIIDPYISALELKNTEVQFDNVQNSTINLIYYGYTPLWDNFISLNGARLNMQIVITGLENEEISYKIGTPIIVTEY